MHFHTEVFLLLATAKAKAVRDCRVSNDHNCFDLVTLVQTLHTCTLQTATNPIIVWLRFTLFTFSVARSDRTSVVYVGYDETRAHINIKVVQGHFYENF